MGPDHSNGPSVKLWNGSLVTEPAETTSPKFIIDRLLPINRVHLLAGISSAGKSRFALPALVMWHACLPVMGLRSWPVPWCVVCGDRPIADAHDTLNSMGIPLSEVPIIPAFGKNNKPFFRIMEEIKDGGYEFVFWEGFDMLVKNPNNPNEVKELLSDVTAYCEEGLTVLGTVGVAKLKPHEIYQNPRQLVAGSSIWERATSSNLIIVPTNALDIGDKGRLLYCSLKNSPSFSVTGSFDDKGILVFKDHDAQKKEFRSRFDKFGEA